jgi:hypothetical protein
LFLFRFFVSFVKMHLFHRNKLRRC